jgi:hypothetical protein
MRRFMPLLLVGSFLAIPAVAQRGGGGFRGGMGGGHRGGIGGFSGEGFVGFGLPDYTEGWDYPDDSSRDYSYSNHAPASIYYGYGPTAPVLQQSPPRVIEYHGPAYTCPQANGKALYRIAVPADNRERKIPPTYQNNISVVQDYSFTNATLNFTTEEGERKQTSIRSIDRALTLQLNRECGVSFQFPH